MFIKTINNHITFKVIKGEKIKIRINKKNKTKVGHSGKDR